MTQGQDNDVETDDEQILIACRNGYKHIVDSLTQQKANLLQKKAN
jgi:hypothetical protein